MVARIIRAQQNLSLLGLDTCFGNDAPKKNQRGNGVGERVVPAKARKGVAKVVFEPKVQDKVAQGEGFLSPARLRGKASEYQPRVRNRGRETRGETAFQ